ncbi:MAG: endonuclease/exonuclease/phosphatase family protein [Opitutaceae bacterium]
MVALAGLWFLAPADVEAAGPAPRPAWVVATYNVGNYTLADRRVGGVFRRAYPKPEIEKTALRSVIARLDADVLILQEIGGEDFLTELRRDLSAEGVVYRYGGVATAADPERRLAWLSRRRPADVRVHTDLVSTQAARAESVRRGLLELRWDESDGSLTVFGVHLKSRLTQDADDPEAARRRIGEAEAIRRRILERVGDLDATRVMVVGDFNDAKSSPVLARFREQGARRLFFAVDATDSRGERWTYRFDREDTYTRVDYVLVSLPLWQNATAIGVDIPDWPEVAVASDHRPVRLQLAR